MTFGLIGRSPKQIQYPTPAPGGCASIPRTTTNNQEIASMLPTLSVPLKHPRALFSAGKVLGLVAILTILFACEKSSHEQLLEARSSLASSSYDDAISAADAGLKANPSKADAWGLELVKLEALARGGNGDGSKQQLTKLAGLYPDQLSPTDYSTTAQQLQAADQGPAAIVVLDLGKKRHPDNAIIDQMIADSVKGENSPEELEMLKSLGYIE